MKKNSFLFCNRFLLIVIFVSSLSCQRSKEEAKTFHVGYLDITASAPLFIAQELGLFEKNNVVIEIEKFASSNQLIDAIAADKIDYVVETSAVPALALQLKSPGRFFITAASTISEQEPFDAILVRKNSGISSLQDLASKKIAVFPGTTAKNLLRAFLQKQGVDVSAIEFFPIPPPNLLASLKSGAVDATHVYEPAWTIGINDPDLVQVYGTVYGKQLAPNPQGISVLNSKTSKSHPRVSKGLIKSFDEALRFMRTNDDSTRSILGKHFALPGNTVKEMHLLYMSTHDNIDWESLEQYVSLLREVGELDGQPVLTSLTFK